MRIVFDLDGTICRLRKSGEDYSQLEPVPEVIQRMQDLKKAGHTIIISTARRMKKHQGNVSAAVADQGLETMQWLAKFNVPYDEIQFGKPFGDVYVDDLTLQFVSAHSLHVDNFNEEMVNILIPMAGLGKRFFNAGYQDPKPLIPVLGKPMIEWALKSFDFLDQLPDYRIICIVREDHCEQYDLEARLESIIGKNLVVIKLKHVTDGQAETCLLAEKYINNYNKLFIYNCDTYSLAPVWDDIKKYDPDGLWSVFDNTDPRYSFARTDENGHVVETAEKIAISNHASTGLYYFKNGRNFCSVAREHINLEKKLNGEYYVAPLYNDLIARGQAIRVTPTTDFWVLGTPEEMQAFEQNYPGHESAIS